MPQMPHVYPCGARTHPARKTLPGDVQRDPPAHGYERPDVRSPGNCRAGSLPVEVWQPGKGLTEDRSAITETWQKKNSSKSDKIMRQI